jgi:hypothetical protein
VGRRGLHPAGLSSVRLCTKWKNADASREECADSTHTVLTYLRLELHPFGGPRLEDVRRTAVVVDRKIAVAHTCDQGTTCEGNLHAPFGLQPCLQTFCDLEVHMQPCSIEANTCLLCVQGSTIIAMHPAWQRQTVTRCAQRTSWTASPWGFSAAKAPMGRLGNGSYF